MWPLWLEGSGGMERRQVQDTELDDQPMIILNGGAGSKGRMAYSCTYFLCFYVYFIPDMPDSHPVIFLLPIIKTKSLKITWI